jgi:serine/threonine protein kinase
LKNILVDDGFHAKICDFGLSEISNKPIIKDKKYGNPLYLAPETLKKNEYSFATDIYNLGIVFYEIIKNYKTEMERACEVSKFKNNKNKIANNELENIILQMVNNDPKARPKAQDIII